MSRAWMRTLFWIGMAALLVLAIHLLEPMLLPFALGAAMAYFLNPLVRRLVLWKLPRPLAAIVVLLGLVVLAGAFGLLLVPLLEVQVGELVKNFSHYLDAARGGLDQAFQLLQDQLSDSDVQRLRDAAEAKLSDLLGGVGDVVTRVLSGGIAVANLLSLFFITPVVAFFLMRDWDRLIETLDDWMPRQHLETIREQARLIDETLSGFLRGQASVCLLLGAFYGIGLTIIGLQSALAVGLFVGALIFIPFLGGLTGGVIATALAAGQFGLWSKPLYVVMLFVVGQTLEANVITPKLIGERVHLHPVWVIFSLLAFGVLFGFLGVLIAVPMAAVLGVLVRFALHRYLESPLYDPALEPPPDRPA
jgi:predicted PurR-regulated permease PerM